MKTNGHAVSPRLTPDEFEEHVKGVISNSGIQLAEFEVERKSDIDGTDGTYEIDVAARFAALGADFLVLIECKRYVEPVKRDTVMTLWAKLQSTGAQKAMLFSTSGFQRGAVTFAKAHGIALVKVADGRTTFFTRSEGDRPPPPGCPRFASWLLPAPGVLSLIDADNAEPLLDWLGATVETPASLEPDDPEPDGIF